VDEEIDAFSSLPRARALVAKFIRDGGGVTGTEVGSITDETSGLYIAVDRVSVVFLDLDAGRAARVPRVHKGSHPLVLRRDGDWLKIVDLVECTVGRGLHIEVIINARDGGPTTRGPAQHAVNSIVPLLG